MSEVRMTDMEGDMGIARPIASTNYGGWVEVECTQICGWKPEKQASSEAVRHVKATGHETAVKHHSSIHYHVRRESDVVIP